MADWRNLHSQTPLMFRRPSLAQPTSSALGNGQTPMNTNSKDRAGYSMSNLKPSSNKEDQDSFNTEELFAKHTVAEIRVIQTRLRGDADAKKEELRQMVGKRYRELLQASSSIISIAQASERVVEALEESKLAVQSQADPPLPKASSVSNVQDRRLQALQILAAHMKLLLDAPEHLWRLIERKKFLPAAWLFLLARVVHRTLVRSDEQEEETWMNQGMDVLAEFPLIQRQWDVVSQFRSQIIHKAILGLRDASSSTEDTCATLVTLHLLDSRPIHDTLSSMLSQRLKTLNASLVPKGQIRPPPLMSPSDSKNSSNGRITFSLSQDNINPSPRKPRIHEVKENLHSVLAIISQTVYVARGIFDGRSGCSLIERVLEFIQSDAEKTTSIPADLNLTTRALLTNITSAAHFQLLPRNLQLYKPYVDLTSSSASLRQEQFSAQLNEWFEHSMKLFHGAVERWFQELESVKEAWSVRLVSRDWAGTSTLEERERRQILEVVDRTCRERTVDIWSSMLRIASSSFEMALETALRSMNSKELLPINSPIDFLFNPVTLPMISQSSSSYDIPLRKYQSALKQQLLGRTALLDNVLNTLEHCARQIYEEAVFIRSSVRGETKSIVDLLVKLHETAAEETIKSSIRLLKKAVDQVEGEHENSTPKLVFLEQVTEDLALRSSFIDHIGCSKTSRDAFVEELSVINSAVLDLWKRRAITCLIRQARRPSLRVIPNLSTGPAPELVQALMSLYGILQEVTFRWDREKQLGIVQDALPLFIETWLNEVHEHTPHDLAFLQEFAKLASVHPLGNKLKGTSELPDLGRVASEYVKQLQTFFPATVTKAPDHGKGQKDSANKFPNLLRWGEPSTEQQRLRGTVELGKPGPRFGLLLVGGESSR